MAARRTKSSDRDSSGRFQRGHSVKSPGNPQVVRMAEFQAAVRRAVSPESLVTVLERMRTIATDSQDEQAAIAAARVLLERCLGKPADAPKLIDLDLGDAGVTTVRDLAVARRKVLSAALSGGLDIAAVPALMQAIDQTGEAELAALSDRIDALERSASGG